MRYKFEGLFTALVTPFKEGNIDYIGLEKLIEFQIQNEVDGIVIAGSTGEKFSLTDSEYKELAVFVKKKVKNRIKIILGTGNNDTQMTIKHSHLAKELEYDGVLIVSPYYNKPSQEGIYAHFSRIADSVDIPIILYNVPSRTASDIELNVVLKLSLHENIFGIKESSSDLKKISYLKNKLTSSNFTILAGDDFEFLNFSLLGAKGVISVASNAIPSIMRKLVDFSLNSNFTEGRNILFQIQSFLDNLFIETNPIPIKEVLKYIGYISNEVRLPLLKMEEKNRNLLLSSYKRILS